MYLVRDVGSDSYFHECFFTNFSLIKDSQCCQKLLIILLSALDKAFFMHSAILCCFWAWHSCASSSGTSLGKMDSYVWRQTLMWGQKLTENKFLWVNIEFYCVFHCGFSNCFSSVTLFCISLSLSCNIFVCFWDISQLFHHYKCFKGVCGSV